MAWGIHGKSQPTTIGGIDPGASGALAFLCPKTWELEVHDMPHYTEEVNGKKRKRVDTHALADLINGGNLAVISTEKVHAMPQMDVKSIFSFGRFYGQLEMAATMAGVEFMETDPAVWKRKMGVNSDKDFSRLRCGILVPAAQPILLRKTDHDRAEAIMLALFCAFNHGLMPKNITLKETGVAAPKSKSRKK